MKIQIQVNGHESNKWKFWIHYVWQLLSMMVVVVAIFASSKVLNKQFSTWVSSWYITPNDIYSLISDHWYVNWAIFVWILFGVAIYIWKNLHNKYFSFVNIGIAVIIMILLTRQDTWQYASSPIPFLNYNWLLFFIAGGYVFGILIRCFRKKRERNRTKTRKLVMTSDDITGVTLSHARAEYAKLLVDELTTSNLEDQTYAVAITGGWGSGKTLFLEKVKEMIKDKAIVVDFNPWNSHNGQHLVKDFFDVLSTKLSPYYGGLRKTTNKYVKMLYSLRFHIASDLILQHLPHYEQENLESTKHDVAEAMNSIHKPIVIAIDDMDRLAGVEIFEMLKIIRNTAKFNNIIYIVTYDKEHVIKQLSQPGLGIEKDYLEKIFQVELSLPKVDERVLEEDFKILCRNGVMKTGQINSSLDSLSEQDYKHILKVLGSFRKVKRFVRQFSFNTNFMLNSFIDSKYMSLYEVMFLNIIQTSDYQLYHKMWIKPELLFDVKTNPKNKCQYYSLKKDVLKDEPASYFMRRLFGNTPSKDSISIQMVDSYYRYFYLSQPEKELSNAEYQDMLKQPDSDVATNGMKATIRSWVLSKEAKNAPSIYSKFANSKPKFHSNRMECKPFISAIFYWIEFENRANANLTEVLPQLLKIQLYASNLHTDLREMVHIQMEKWIYRGQYGKVAEILSKLYVEIDAGAKLLIDGEVVKMAIDTNIKELLKSQDWDAVLLFKDDDNLLQSVTKTYCVQLPSSGKRINLAITQLISFFSEAKHRSQNWKQVEKYRNVLNEYNTYGEVADTSIWGEELKNVFGDDMNIAANYVEKCFNWKDTPDVIKTAT